MLMVGEELMMLGLATTPFLPLPQPEVLTAPLKQGEGAAGEGAEGRSELLGNVFELQDGLLLELTGSGGRTSTGRAMEGAAEREGVTRGFCAFRRACLCWLAFSCKSLALCSSKQISLPLYTIASGAYAPTVPLL